jgi:hypothetical protein
MKLGVERMNKDIIPNISHKGTEHTENTKKAEKIIGHLDIPQISRK